MGPLKNPNNPGATPAGRRPRHPARRPRARRCLLKGCERRFRPGHPRQRYCSQECRQAARSWSRWKAQHKYRNTGAGRRKRNGQSRRYRERCRKREQQQKQAVEEGARVITANFFRGQLRPAWLLRRIPQTSSQSLAEVLFAPMPARPGASVGARAALATHTRWLSKPARLDRLDILLPLR